MATVMADARHILYALIGSLRWQWSDHFFRCDYCDRWERGKFYVDDGCWYRQCRLCRKTDAQRRTEES